MSPYFGVQLDCRLCGGVTQQIADFGLMALTSTFPLEDEDDEYIPLTVRRCNYCNLVQLGQNTAPERLYRKGYGYKSGINETMVEHLKYIVKLGSIYQPKKVLDIGCNDGTLLKEWLPYGVQAKGYDPLAEPVEGAEVVRDYFRPDGKMYDVITTIAMLYDAQKPKVFAQAVADSLAPDGAWILEVGYAGSLFEGCWDGVCHEHLTYYGLKQIHHLAETIGFHVEHFELNDVNAGSLLCVLRRGIRSRTEELNRTIATEDDWDWWQFGAHCNMLAKNIRKHCAIGSRKIYALGASTKGNTILQHARLGGRIVAAIDRNPEKHGRFTPGTRIPIRSEEWARANPPDAFLVLPYHFRAQLLEREKDLRARGVKFIFPLPTVEEV